MQRKSIDFDHGRKPRKPGTSVYFLSLAEKAMIDRKSTIDYQYLQAIPNEGGASKVRCMMRRKVWSSPNRRPDATLVKRVRTIWNQSFPLRNRQSVTDPRNWRSLARWIEKVQKRRPPKIHELRLPSGLEQTSLSAPLPGNFGTATQILPNIQSA